jgi:co-chaperonin GroES (HSP10)
MKAKLYVSGTKSEIRLSDDSVYTPNKKESKEKFLERVKDIVNNEHLDDEFTVVEITKDVVALNDDKALNEALKTAEGLQKELITQVLTERNGAKEKAKKPTIVAVSVDEAKATEAYAEALANVGKHVSFSPFKSEEVYEGKIAGIALNKTNTIIYYTVVEANGKRRCCGVLNESVKFITAPPAVEKEAKAKKTKKVDAAPAAETVEAEAVEVDAEAGDELQ